MTHSLDPAQIKEAVRAHYGPLLTQDRGCCSPSCCLPSTTVGVPQHASSQALGYALSDLALAPEGADLGLGCGNPVALASLAPGDSVLDLGSGGGLDCFLAAKQVGPQGHVIGVDMTQEMIDRARESARKSDSTNVEFRLGEIEHLPVHADTIDVILSNCVLNLSPQKEQVLAEAYRVLKPGGRLAIHDIVLTHALPQELAASLALLVGCVGQAAGLRELEEMLVAVGFDQIHLDVEESSKEMINAFAPELQLGRYAASAAITAIKPKAS